MRINVSDSVFQISELKSPKDYFPYQISDYLNNYIAYCKKNSVPSEIVDNIEYFKVSIINCLFDYCSGQHTNAKWHLSEALSVIPILQISRPLHDGILYRARKTKRKFFKLIPQKYTLEGMFHIPFELRYLVGNERYSFPGLPCLYFGSSPDVCCLELSNYSKYLNIAQFSVNSLTDYRIIDFCFFDDYDFNNISDEQAILFYSVWPLVAVCSFRYADLSKSQKMSFRQDYIIPQLLLESIIDKNALDHDPAPCLGIRYYSARKKIFDISGMCEDASKYINYAFPAQDIREQGSCNVLKNIFFPERVVFMKDLT